MTRDEDQKSNGNLNDSMIFLFFFDKNTIILCLTESTFSCALLVASYMSKPQKNSVSGRMTFPNEWKPLLTNIKVGPKEIRQGWISPRSQINVKRNVLLNIRFWRNIESHPVSRETGPTSGFHSHVDSYKESEGEMSPSQDLKVFRSGTDEGYLGTYTVTWHRLKTRSVDWTKKFGVFPWPIYIINIGSIYTTNFMKRRFNISITQNVK